MRLLLRSGPLRGSTVLSSPQGRVVAARRYGVAGRCAAFIVLATALAAAARASGTTMTVDSARDNRSAAEYTTTDFEVLDLNTDAEEGFVRVWDGVTNWWEARYTDPYPGDIPAGSELTSVVVTVQYLMEAATWDGTLTINARTSVVSLGMTAMPEHTSATQETWDITSLINGEADPLATLNDLRIRLIDNDTSGPGVNVVWSYTIVDVEFNAPPDQPSITSPTADQLDVSRTPTIEADTFSDPDADAHGSSDWEVFADDVLSNLVASSMTDATNLESIDVTAANVTFEGSLSGKIALAADTEYWARVCYRDANGLASYWSEPRHFTTGTGQPPSQPSIIDPVAPATDISRRPTVTADAFSDPEGDAHGSSDWEIFDSASCLPADLVASSMTDTTNLETISVDPDNVAFEGALAGRGNLASSTQYWVRVTYRDEYGAESTSEAVAFTTADNLVHDTPTISPLGATASRNPTVTASAYNDPDYDAHASSDWEIFDSASCLSADLVASSMNDTTNLESIDVDSGNVVFEGALAGRGNLDPLTEYWVTVTYRDEYGAEATSVEVNFTTKANAAPDQASISSPTADETVVALNPVVVASPYSDPDGDPHFSTDWEIYEDDLLTSRVAYSLDDTSNLASIGIEAASGVTFEGSLSGKTSLERATEYWVRARFTEELSTGPVKGPWSVPVRFETGDFPTTETWPFFGSGCSSAPRGSSAPAHAPVPGLVSLAAFVWAFLLCRRATPCP